jgi:hypothetical protein
MPEQHIMYHRLRGGIVHSTQSVTYNPVIMHSIYSISRKIGRGAMPRIIKPARENWIGVLLLVVTGVYGASQHHWSKRTLFNNLWETVAMPCLLVVGLLICVHIWQASREIYVQERRPFTNALNRVVMLPPWHFRWRCYIATALWWTVCAGFVILAWNKYPIPLPGRGRFVVEASRNVFLPDLSVLNNLPKPKPPPEKDRPPSLLDLFNEDYPTAMKSQNNLTLRGVKVPLKQVVYLDFPAKSKFVGLYVPSPRSADTVIICKAFTDQVEPALKSIEKDTYIKGGMGTQNAREISDLTFTNVVVIYHEAILNIEEEASIIAVFKDRELDVQFRGPDYVAYRDDTWTKNRTAKDN